MVQSSETSLASIAQSLKGIASVMAKLNENLVAFAKQARETSEVTEMPASSVSDEYIKALGERYEGYAGGLTDQVDAQFESRFKKEGE